MIRKKQEISQNDSQMSLPDTGLLQGSLKDRRHIGKTRTCMTVKKNTPNVRSPPNISASFAPQCQPECVIDRMVVAVLPGHNLGQLIDGIILQASRETAKEQIIHLKQKDCQKSQPAPPDLLLYLLLFLP